jgi:AraC family transcriptional regulator
MLFRDPSFDISPIRSSGFSPVGGVLARGPNQTRLGDHLFSTPRPHSRPATPDQVARQRVEISPAVKRHMATGQNIAVEIVQSTGSERIEHRFCADKHLLVVCEEGVRQDGETILGDLPRSSLRNLARKLTFVPAGYAYQDCQQPRTAVRLIYIYFEPAAMKNFAQSEPALHPRLLFEDKMLWDSALKLKRLAERQAPEDGAYFDALGAVLMHELLRLGRGTSCSEAPIRGGLAVWQQRLVTAYIEEHLAEAVPLQTLAQLVRLSPHYFCRAFKQSFGLPPHRYHGIRRIERAKAMLASGTCSVTEIGMRLGFSETSSFSTAFRKVTGMTPTAYHRTLG